jgi:hypothetical protein
MPRPKKNIFYGYCIEVKGEMKTGQSDIPYMWSVTEKSLAIDFMRGEFGDEAKLIKVVLVRKGVRRI